MARFGTRLVEGMALLLITLAVPIVLWFPQMPAENDPNGRIGSTGLPISTNRDASGGRITYRFLYRGEAGALEDRLTLGRFLDGALQERPRWGLIDTRQWFDWAPDIFAREPGWAAENQPGWRISTWLRPDASVECDSEQLFWVIQALRLLDPESLANEIDMLEGSGQTVRIVPTHGPSDYDYDEDTLYWNPMSTEHIPADERLKWKWFQTDPLVALAHVLNHAWHDLCRGGDAASVEERERLAVAAENRLRHTLFLKDPACSHLYPRPGHQETWPDLPGASALEAWGNYYGRVPY
ncbi:MAG: hypothetical protein JSW27_04240 [Phycisphaerales bacterium]|nr:MAG: hypothetical protein JSW27_04240 [Phycisphaerales bacterium]